MPSVEFWFEFASTYSYPAAMQIEDKARAAGVDVVYRPFLLGPLFAAQGLVQPPFLQFPIKGRYMWRDLERLCQEYGLPFRRPSEFPRNGLSACRVALLGAEASWGPRFVRAVYRANFVEDRDISRSDVIAGILASLARGPARFDAELPDLGREPAEILEQAAQPELKQRLRAQTEQAQRLGIFGAPSFVVNGELFWGHDRLDQALRWARRGA
jgi:2-hydroxychromene-2-carboxylate isomerase